MKDKIVLTSNMVAASSMVESLKKKPERVDRMGLIHGKWGLGKTTFMMWFFANTMCFYVRSMAAWKKSPTMMVEDILRAYRVEAKGKLREDVREIVRVAKKYQYPLFIDEADRVVGRSILIETIRDIHDLAKIPIILIGQENIVNLLQRKDLGQVFSRITEMVEFKSLSAQDIQRISKELCDLTCDIKAASFVQTITLGDFRLINALLTRAEEMCFFNKKFEITMQIAKECSMSISHSGDMHRVGGMESAFEQQAIAAAGNI